MLKPEEKLQFAQIFNELAKALDITKAQYDAAVTSYQFVGDWLSRPESPLAPFKPEILPQGSFLLGTMVSTINENDDLDIDSVCKLTGKLASWTQYDVKQIVGNRLKDHKTILRMLDKEGRRCWTVLHREEARFHLDILPSIISEEFFVVLERSMSVTDLENLDSVAIRITDKTTKNYRTSTNPVEWLKSNPFGYAAWFKLRASFSQRKVITLNEAIQPVPENEFEKLPLQRVVQILKRHRDIIFNGDEHKPISIIITTLSARAYNGESDVLEALLNVVGSMETYIENRYDSVHQRMIKWVSNPVNPVENFADKWLLEPEKEKKFYQWLYQVKKDVTYILAQRGLYNIQEVLSKQFGTRTASTVFSKIGEEAKKQRDVGAMKMAATTGMLGNAGRTTVGYHNNYGSGR